MIKYSELDWETKSKVVGRLMDISHEINRLSLIQTGRDLSPRHKSLIHARFRLMSYLVH